MRWMRTAQWTSLWATFVGMLAAAPLPGLAQEPSTAPQKEAPVAEVLSPEDGARVPRKDEDPSCPEQGPCTKVYVKGRVATGYWPFLAVAPLNAAPRIWIQPPITTVRRDGTFTGMVYLGTEKVGAGEKYNIHNFRGFQIFMTLDDNDSRAKLSLWLAALRTFHALITSAALANASMVSGSFSLFLTLAADHPSPCVPSATPGILQLNPGSVDCIGHGFYGTYTEISVFI